VFLCLLLLLLFFLLLLLLALTNPLLPSFSKIKDLPPSSEKRVISYGLYGSNPKYTQGAIRNAELVDTYFPGETKMSIITTITYYYYHYYYYYYYSYYYYYHHHHHHHYHHHQHHHHPNAGLFHQGG